MKTALRFASITVSLAALALIAAQLHSRRPVRASVRLVDTGKDLQEILRERAEQALDSSAPSEGGRAQSAGIGLSMPEPGASDGWVPLRRTAIDPQVVARLTPTLERDINRKFPRVVYDPQAYYIGAPGWKGKVTFRDHPAGGWPTSYNQLGFRHPNELADPPPEVRVILCGDSHLEGLVPWSETTTALLEIGLRGRLRSRSVEVLNGAKGGYDINNYVGFLEYSLALKPQVFVVVVYGGNDFAGLLVMHAYLERFELKYPDRKMQARITAAAERHMAPMAQAFHQIAHFKGRPRNAQIALDASIRALRDMHASATKAGVALICAYLPPQHDVRPQDMRAELDELIEHFDFSEDDLRITDRLADQLLDELDSQGLNVVDLRPALRAEPERTYWESDHHLNTRGHHVVARELLPHILAPLFEGR